METGVRNIIEKVPRCSYSLLRRLGSGMPCLNLPEAMWTCCYGLKYLIRPINELLISYVLRAWQYGIYEPEGPGL